MSPDKLKWMTIRIDADALNLDGSEPDPEEEQMISFICPTCKQEIEASRDMSGETTPCPNCGAPIVVPAESTSNTLHSADSKNMDAKSLQAMKGRTMRIDLGDEF